MKNLPGGLLTAMLIFLFPIVNAQQIDKHQLNVGDRAPELNIFKWLKGDHVPSFKKGKIYVLEFGATWCAPCATAIPKLTKLQRDHIDDVIVIGVFTMEPSRETKLNGEYAYISRVKKYIEKKGDAMKYTVGVDDPNGSMEESWLIPAGAGGIPYAFVVDREGFIAWKGTSTSELPKVIEAVRSKGYSRRQVSPTLGPAYTSATSFEELKGLLDSLTSELKLVSLLTVYELGQQDRMNVENPYYIDSYQWASPGSRFAANQDKLCTVGETLRRLYFLAYGDTLWNYPPMMSPGSGIYPDTVRWPSQKRSYGKFWYRPLLELQDSSAFEANYKSPDNRYNYILKVEHGKGTAKRLQQELQNALRAAFGYSVTVEKRMMPCWELNATDVARKLLPTKSKSFRMYADSQGNARFEYGEIRDIIFQLEIKYGYGFGAMTHQSNLQPPFIDRTGIKGKIDYTFAARFVQAMSDAKESGRQYPFEEYMKMLKDLGLELSRSYKPMNVVVIRRPVGQIP